MTLDEIFRGLLRLIPPAVDHEFVIGLEGTLHYETVEEVGVPDILHCEVGIHEGGLVNTFEVELVEFEGGFELRDECVDVVSEGGLRGLLLDEGAYFRVDQLHYNTYSSR